MTASTEHLSEEELFAQLNKAKQSIEVGAFYAHYRDPQVHYKVIGLTVIEATQEVAVAYCKIGSPNAITWIRPLHSWLEKVSTKSGPVPRFQKIAKEEDVCK